MNNLLNNKSSTTALVYLLLFVLLALRIGGAVSHYCFDGLEPPVSIHFDNLSGHVEHADDVGHTDVEKQVLADNLLSKIFEVDSMLVILALIVVMLFPLGNAQSYSQLALYHPSRAKNFQPPLRAPPLYS